MKQPISILVGCAVLALSACGQKGPLYLPDRGNGVVVTRPAATEAQPPGESAVPASQTSSSSAAPAKKAPSTQSHQSSSSSSSS